MPERLYILDAHSLIYQVFHAIPEMSAPDGTPTNAVFGFIRDILMLRKDKRPDYLLCAFDAPGETFRHELSADYKANRSAMPDDLRPQIAMIRSVLDAYRIPSLAMPGYEADDILASVAARAAERGIEAFLCTADKDMRQTIGDRVRICDLRRNRIIDREYVEKDWGITPEQVVDYQSMVGDKVDNIAGIAGVGAKTAAKLLQSYGSLEEIFKHVDEIPGKKMKENFYKGRAAAAESRELVKLKTDLPLPENWDDWRPREPNQDELIALFTRCGFHRFVDDLRRERPTEDAWVAQYHCVRDREAFGRLLDRLAEQRRISIDLETTHIRPAWADIVGYAISWEPGEAFYVAVRAPERQTALEPAWVLERLRPMLESPEIEKVGQNLKYDLVVLRRAGIEMRGVVFDSMVASYLLEPGERSHKLDDLSERFLDHATVKISELIGSGKQQIRIDEVDVQRVAAYAGEDADVALRLTERFAPELAEQGLEKLFRDVECPLIEVLAAMEFAGIRVDRDRLESLSGEFAERIATTVALAYEAAGREFNLDSPAQMRVLLFDELKLPVVKRNKTGPSTDQEVLEELADRHPVCALVLEYRKLAKLKGTYIDALPALIHPETGRIHASFNQAVAATGRLSSSDPNLQNIPIRTEDGRQIRQAFIAGADDRSLLTADYSQIELRMLAYFSDDANLKRAFLEDQDIHAAVAARIHGVEPDAVTAEMRRRAKAVNFGIMYGLSPFGLARQLKIDKGEAAAFIDAYFDQYPGIESWFTEVLEAAVKERAVTTILGRRRPISGIKNTTGRNRNLPERTAINTVIQGSAADLIKLAMLGVHRRLAAGEVRATMLLQIHDELVFEVERDDVDSLANLVDEEMAGALDLDGVPLKVDLAVGPNWLDQTPLRVGVGQA